MLTGSQIEQLRDKVIALLGDVGMKVENDDLVAALERQGASQSPSGRMRIPTALIEQMVRSQQRTAEEDRRVQALHVRYGIDWTHYLLWTGRIDEASRWVGRSVRMSAFDCGPTKYHDYVTGKALPVDTAAFIQAMQFAQATPEIGYISTWYRQDVPQPVERIESLVVGLQHTDKVDGIEAILPAQIKYLKAIGEIIYEQPGVGCYLAGSQCITSPLILEARSATEMVERKRQGIPRYHICSMPTIGVTSPLSLAGSIVMSAAEVLGGMATAFAWDPEGDLTGRQITSVVDMRSANITYSAPEAIATNLAVKELFDACWGGHLWTEVYISPCAKVPGMQAVYENFYAASLYSRLTGEVDVPYPGMGTLDNGSTGSLTQFMLDLEIRKSQAHLRSEIEVTTDTLMFDELRNRIESGSGFFDSDYTLTHFRDLWSPRLFLADAIEPGRWDGSERAILRRCEEQWRENLKHYRPPEWPEYKLRALERVAAEARKELL